MAREEKAAVPWALLVASPHALNWGPLISQMYVQHDIYDLIFKYVGTMEASEVGPKSSLVRMGASFFAFYEI